MRINKCSFFVSLFFHLCFKAVYSGCPCDATSPTWTSSAGSDATAYSVGAGQKLYIPPGSTITGSITLGGGTIVNEGIFSASTFTFTSGTFDNCGSVTNALVIAGTFNNCTNGTITNTGFTVGASAIFANYGTATSSGNFLIGNSATFTNCGTLSLNGASSSFSCGASAIQTNKGTLNTYNFTHGSNSTFYNECVVNISNNFLMGNTAVISGPTSGSLYGRFNVSGTATILHATCVFGSGTSQLDMCHNACNNNAGNACWTTQSGTVGASVTYCTNTGCTNACIDALPIQLLDFKAQCNSNRTATILWSTATETNNDFFTIEKTKDGVNFQTIAIVKGKGNSTNKIDYSIDDEVPLKGVSYYRLKQTDFDGKSSYSDIESVLCEAEQNNSCNLYHVSNVHNVLSIGYSCTEYTGIMNVQMINMLGQPVFMDRQYTQKGNNTFEINTEGIASGMYILKLSNKDNSFQKKFVK